MREVATYDYKDEQGALLYQVVRFEPKDFRQRTPDGQWGLNGARRVLYRLPELVKSGEANRHVLIVEGEKDVDRLAREKLIATCNPMGAGKWQAEYGQWLKGRTVIVLPDNDKPGLEHAQQIVKSLTGVASKVAVLHLEGLPEKGDVSWWLDNGHTKAELIQLCKGALENDVRTLLDSARRLDRRSRWLAVRQIIADLEADEM